MAEINLSPELLALLRQNDGLTGDQLRGVVSDPGAYGGLRPTTRIDNSSWWTPTHVGEDGTASYNRGALTIAAQQLGINPDGMTDQQLYDAVTQANRIPNTYTLTQDRGDGPYGAQTRATQNFTVDSSGRLVPAGEEQLLDRRPTSRWRENQDLTAMLALMGTAGAASAYGLGAGAATPAAGGATTTAGSAVPAATTAAGASGAGAAVPAAAGPTAGQALSAAGTAASVAGSGGGSGGADVYGSDWSNGVSGTQNPGLASTDSNWLSSLTSNPQFQQLASRLGPAVAAQLLSRNGNTGLFQSTARIDPNVQVASDRQSALGAEIGALGLDQFRQGQAYIDRFSPVYDSIIGNNQRVSGNALDMSNQLFDQYRTSFAPMADQYSKAVSEFGTDQDARDAQIAATVQSQADAAEASRLRNLASVGVDPASGRNIQGGVDLANKTALMKVGAINNDRAQTRLNKINVLGQGLNAGSQMLGAGAQMGNQALTAGQSTASTIGGQAVARSAALNPGTNLLGQSANINSSVMNAGLGRFQAENAAQSDAFKTNLGTLGTIGGIIGGMYTSSKESKENIEPVDEDRALQGLRKVPVKEYDYKTGQGDGGHHVGPMAEDMNAQFGDQVAPGGQAIDIPSQFGVHHAALQALDKKITRLEKLSKVKSAPDSDSSMPARRSDSGISLRPLRM